MKPMTMRERMLAVIRGQEHDRVPFVEYGGMSPVEESAELLGPGAVGRLQWTGVSRVETPNCHFENEDIEAGGLQGVRVTLHTPEGTLTQEKFYTPAMGTSAAPAMRRQFVREPADYRALQAYLRDVQVVPDVESLSTVVGELGEAGLPHLAVGRTPWQALWVEWVLIEDLSWHLLEAPELVDETASLLGDVVRRQCEIAAGTDAPYVCVPDNITAPLIGVERFRKYCVPYYNELAGLLDGRPVYVHMDGDLAPLWQAIGESRVGGLDSMSPPPDNDTSVAEALRMWPEMRVGVNFPSSVHLCESEVIHETTRRILAEARGTGRLQIQISENMPPGAWRKSYPAIVRAVEDFGPPCA